MKKAPLLCAVLAGALVLPAGAADAKRKAPLFTAGIYSGEAADGARIDFTATKRSLTHFAFSDLKVKCDDGQESEAGQRDSDRIPLSRKTGKFTGAQGQFGFNFELSGKLRKKKGSGTLRVTYRTSPGGGLNANGPIFCDSGVVKWTATTY